MNVELAMTLGTSSRRKWEGPLKTHCLTGTRELTRGCESYNYWSHAATGGMAWHSALLHLPPPPAETARSQALVAPTTTAGQRQGILAAWLQENRHCTNGSWDLDGIH